MTEYSNELRGVLFRNEKQRDGRRDPDYTGSCEIDEVEYWLSAWINVSKKDGKKFMSIKFKPKEEEREEEPQRTAKTHDDFDDDIPF